MNKKVLEVKNLGKKIGRAKIIDNVSFCLETGEVCGLVGQNGVGKTTLMRMICGLMKTVTGTLSRYTENQIIGYMPQSCRFKDTQSVRKTLRFFADLRNSDITKGEEICKTLELNMEKKVKHLSPGQQKKLLLAIAMIGNPEFYVLDEPTAGLDPKATDEMLKLIERLASQGKTILISSHILSHIENLCTSIAVMGSNMEFVKTEWKVPVYFK